MNKGEQQSQKKYSKKLISNIFDDSKNNPLNEFYLPGEDPVSEQEKINQLILEKKEEFRKEYNDEILNGDDNTMHSEYANYLDMPSKIAPKRGLPKVIRIMMFKIVIFFNGILRSSIGFAAGLFFFCGIFMCFFSSEEKSLGALFIIVSLIPLWFSYKEAKKDYEKYIQDVEEFDRNRIF